MGLVGLLSLCLRWYLPRHQGPLTRIDIATITQPQLQEVDMPPPNYRHVYPSETNAPSVTRTVSDDERGLSLHAHLSSDLTNLDTQDPDPTAEHHSTLLPAFGRRVKGSRSIPMHSHGGQLNLENKEGLMLKHPYPWLTRASKMSKSMIHNGKHCSGAQDIWISSLRAPVAGELTL